MRQVPAPFLIGERLNTQGSRVFKELMLKKDYSTAVGLARAQMENGAHALDLCTALTEDSAEAERMAAMVKLLASQVDAPLVIDSTDPEVMEAALRPAPAAACSTPSIWKAVKAKPAKFWHWHAITMLR